MPEMPFPSKDTISSADLNGSNVPVESLSLGVADLAARTGSTDLLDEILSHAAELHVDRRYTTHWGINE